MDRITRKELKSDKFAQEVSHTVEYISEHKKQFLRYGGLGLAVVLAVAGTLYWRRSQAEARQTALSRAMEIEQASIGSAGNGLSFPTKEARDKAAQEAYQKLASEHKGSKEGAFAAIRLGAKASERGELAEARKYFEQAMNGPREYVGLAKYSLAQVAAAEGKLEEAERLLREVMANPSVLVPKEQAAITLAQALAKSKPEEARKLLEPLLKDTRQAISRNAEMAMNALPPAPAK